LEQPVARRGIAVPGVEVERQADAPGGDADGDTPRNLGSGASARSQAWASGGSAQEPITVCWASTCQRVPCAAEREAVRQPGLLLGPIIVRAGSRQGRRGSASAPP
jgi:hypothetical protein